MHDKPLPLSVLCVSRLVALVILTLLSLSAIGFGLARRDQRCRQQLEGGTCFEKARNP